MERSKKGKLAAAVDPSSTSNPSKQTSHLTDDAIEASNEAKAIPIPTPARSVVMIARNKHWRYISMYHGPWLQLSIDQLEHLVAVNSLAARPRAYDSAVLHDVLHIRKAVEEAADLAVRAASGYISAPAQLSGVAAGKGVVSGAAALGLTFGSKGPPVKLSRERQFRMREMALQKLAEAYRLDEIATSVATMQSASTLDELAQHVLQRNPQDPDALYVHFFHEKIPTRKVAEFTSLEPLDTLIREGQHVASALRTRAVIKLFKEDYEGAVQDLTAGIREVKCHVLVPDENSQSDLNPGETEMESQRSLEAQMLFYRANTYLRLATRRIQEALDFWEFAKSGSPTYSKRFEESSVNINSAEDAHLRHIEIRKLIKINARRGLRDYMSFISLFEYAPRVPIAKLNTHEDFEKNNIYKLSELFSPSFPVNKLPKYPPDSRQELEDYPVNSSNSPDFTLPGMLNGMYECVNFHPLLPEALCSLLLCHAIMQTPPTELRRHSHMSARLIRLSGGLPVFSIGRAGSGADWGEVLESTNNFLDLPYSWTELCGSSRMSSIEDDDINARYIAAERLLFAEEQREALIKSGFKNSVKNDDINRTIKQQQSDAEDEHKDKLKHNSNTVGDLIRNTRWLPINDGSNDIIRSTTRAEAIARWIKEAPLNVEGEGAKSKKGGKKRSKKRVSLDATGSIDARENSTMTYGMKELTIVAAAENDGHRMEGDE